MIWSVTMLFAQGSPCFLPKVPHGFAQDSPRLWAFLPNGTGTFPHKDEQFCSSLWAKMLIMTG